MASEVCSKAKGLSQAHNWVMVQASKGTKQKCTQCKQLRDFEAPKKGTQWMGKGVKETPLDTIAGQPVKGSAILLGRGIKAVWKLSTRKKNKE